MPEDLARKIAAGEVVERPSSIVKELLENALDAGASDITVELERGGCGSIRIVDNGEGIDPIEVPLAFERYATSKIYRFDDIYRVASYGFRGEALPSIASVSRVEMTTRKRSSLSGTKIIVEGGQVKMISETGCPAGTSVFVSRIFDSVPVRKKFLKSDVTEQGHCVDVITKMALAHSGVRVKVTANKKEILHVPATENASDRISLVLGVDFMNHLLPVTFTKGETTCRGFISRPQRTRSSAKHLYFYVNGRYVRDYLLNHAVMTAYRRLIEAKRYPAVVLHIELPPEDVDVNVHPAKREVRFRHPRRIYDMTVEALLSALSRAMPAEDTSIAPDAHGIMSHKHQGDYTIRAKEALKRYTLPSGRGKLFFSNGEVHHTLPRVEESDLYGVSKKVTEQPEEEGQRIVFGELEYLGQCVGTYLVFASPHGLIVVDQHAAHERVLFEKIKGLSPEGGEKAISQRLLLPEVVSLSPADYALISECMNILEDVGVEAELFGENSIVVKSMPALLSHVHPRDVIFELLDACAGAGKQASLQGRREMIFVHLACRGAVKASHELSLSEVAALCSDLDATAFSSTCPHGRPVHVSFSVRDMEKSFKRK